MKKIFLLLFFALFLRADFSAPYLDDKVDFWTKVYTFWDSNQVIFSDSANPKLVYYVMDLPKIPNEISAPKFSKEVAQKKDQIKKIIDHLQFKTEISNIDAKLYEHIKEVLKDFEFDDTKLSDRVRNQSGLKSQFELGLKMSGSYMHEMKAMLDSMNMPQELLALVFVESLGHLHVVSHASAAGPWGFLKESAKNFGIHVNNLVDERRDPLLATKAAASYLKKSYENLKSWPLAITSYNYGYPGTLRATIKLETNDLEKVLKEHYSPIFGFASKNYYAEFLAAKNILENEKKYFPNLIKDQAWKYEIVEIKHPLRLTDIFAFKKITKEEIIKLNPSLSQRVLNGKEVLPTGFALRISVNKVKDFYDITNKIPVNQRINLTSLVSGKYRASGKESLHSIAKKNGISSEYLAQRFKKGEDYKPKGTILIRSVAHLFSSIKQEFTEIFNKQAVAKNNAEKDENKTKK